MEDGVVTLPILRRMMSTYSKMGALTQISKFKGPISFLYLTPSSNFLEFFEGLQ